MTEQKPNPNSPFDSSFPGFELPKQTKETHNVKPNEFVSIPLDAAPLEVVENKDGTSTDILARIKANSIYSYLGKDTSTDLLVLRNEKGDISFEAVSPSGKRLSKHHQKVKYKNKPTTIKSDSSAPLIEVLFTPPQKGEKTATLYLGRPAFKTSSPVEILTATDAGTKSDVNENIYTKTNVNKLRKSRRKLKIAAFALGMSLINNTGSAIDMALDPFNDAGVTVKEAFPFQSPDKKAAVNHIAQIMQELDEGNIQGITARAEQFKQQNKDQLMPEAKVAEFQERIKSATSHDQVMHVLNEFMQFYGKHAAYRTSDIGDKAKAFNPQATSVDTLRDYAAGTVDAFSFLPKDHVKKAHFTHIQYASSDEDTQAAGAYLDPEIVIIAHPMTLVNERKDAQETVLHEFAHAEDENLINEESHIEHSAYSMAPYAIRYFFDIPKDVSAYAAHNPGEHNNEQYAENNSYLLTGTGGNALAHPNNVRLFTSEANKKLLNELIRLEVKYPGISDYIIQHAGTGDKSGLALLN